MRYDRSGDQHYDVTSAFIKSIRGSDVDAALHYLARMIEAGEDPRFIARRLMIHASEDIGMADPTALPVAVAAAQVVQLVGLPEARIALAQATIHLATAPKSNAVITAIDAAMADVQAGQGRLGAAHLRDGHYPGAAKLGNAQSYVYPHDRPGACVRPAVPAGRIGRPRLLPADDPRRRAGAGRSGCPSCAASSAGSVRSAAGSERVALDRAAHAPRAAAAAAQLAARDVEHLDAVRAQVACWW